MVRLDRVGITIRPANAKRFPANVILGLDPMIGQPGHPVGRLISLARREILGSSPRMTGQGGYFPPRPLALMPMWRDLAAHARSRRAVTIALALLTLAGPAFAQAPPGPPAVGVVTVQPATITETSEFIGRVQAIQRVAVTARVTAFLEQRLFVEGTEVHAGDLLYKLERGPFEADLAQKEAAVADNSARLANATIQLNRAQTLLGTPAGQKSNVDDAVAAQRSAAAQLASAQGALRQSHINLDYTEIHAPIDGEISRTSITPGNVVSLSSGPLAFIVSQDPMYVTFPVAVRLLSDLRARYADRGGLNAVQVRLKLPDGTPYDQSGKIDYVDPSVSVGTDTILVRAVMPNPVRGTPEPGRRVERTLIDGAFVSALVEGVQPVTALGVPRAAVMSDQSGNYVFVVGADNKVERRPIQLGQSTATLAVIAGGLKQGETVILEGLQRARPGMPVAPGPVTPAPAAVKVGER
jgi:membrane fusion protein (multidrug efflux system)